MRFLILLIILKYTIAERNSFSLTFEVENNAEFCFYHQFNNTIEYVLNYGILKGGNFDIDFILSLEIPNSASDQQVVYHKEKTSIKDTVKFNGNLKYVHKFCFRNYFSPISHKIVFMDIKPADKGFIETLREEANSNQLPIVFTKTDAALNEIHATFTNITNVQYYFRYEESIDRNFAEYLRFKVSFLSSIEFSLIMIVALIQVNVVKRLFYQRKNSALI